MKSILDIQVSCFRDYNTPGNPKEVNLLKWLQSDKYKDTVLQIRQQTDKGARDALKAKLPAITPSGIFTHRRKSDLVTHSGFLSIDIDLDEKNKQIRNWDDLPAQMANIPNIAYFGLSVSGRGYWGLIPIHPDAGLHKAYFEYVSGLFNERLKISLDPACSDVSRLRGYSYDPQAYFNHTAVRLDPPPQKPVKTAVNASNQRDGFKEVTEKNKARDLGLKQVKYLIDKITGTPGHTRLLAAARLMGGFVAKGIFEEVEAISMLQDWAKSNSYLGSEPNKLESYLRTVCDGIKDGKKEPIYPSKKQKDPPAIDWDRYLQPSPTVTPPPGFTDFRTYTQGLEVDFNFGLLINGFGYPALWDTTPQYKYIDKATKNYIEVVTGYLFD